MWNRNILVLGAGRSSAALIAYLLQQATQHAWKVTVGDVALKHAQAHVADHPNGEAIAFSIDDARAGSPAIAAADVVISLLPAHLHPEVGKLCLQNRKHLVTASYVSEEMKQFDAEARQLGLLFLNECGLDPGIDHMSAMQVLDRIKAEGGKTTSFESFTGGLIAPETDPENPWRYKFTWNPRNVVMAGQGTARFLQDGKYRYIPYQQLFTRTTPVVVPGYGAYEGYANRDSLKYLETYQLENIQTMIRGTLRNQGYCRAWNILVQLGCCDDSYIMEDIAAMTHREFMQSFLPADEPAEKLVVNLFSLEPDGEEMKRLAWSGLFSDEKIGLSKGSPARILEHILNKRWKLVPGDKDFIVMWHRFRYEQEGKSKCVEAWLTATGNNEVHTAMAKTVGLPLGIAAKLVLQNKLRAVGVTIPVTAEFYLPILEELRTFGIALQEREVER
ncbi:MAG: saccharopine dehydrogenase NADP-binding domain-containing protein [Cyclobacteriaceae bacterium]|nr:saccharopine dehydrogenase NADP-binding domain-containing protein [Cyclobacteriaceae bacterium]